MAVRFCEKPHNVDPVVIIEQEEVSTVPRYHEINYLIAVAERGQDVGELRYPHCVAIDPTTNQIYVTERCSRVSIFSETGEFKHSFTHEYMRYLYGIAIHGDNVYLTDISEDLVFRFKLSIDIRLVARLGGKGSGVGQFNMPKQLTTSAHGDVFVTDYNNHRIQILDSKLRYQRQISHLTMAHPIDVKLTAEFVYVLTTGSTCVSIFSFAGDKINSLITRGRIGMQVINPQFLCLDVNENLIISDCDANQIKIFTKEGTLLNTLGGRGHEAGMFYKLLGIALTNNLKLVVVSWNNNFRLQLFSCS